MKLETRRIETKRLILRQFEIEDAHDMFVNYASDPEVTKYLSWPAYTEETEAVGRMHWMRDQYAAGNVGDWAIELKEIGQLIGGIGIVGINENAKSVHIGYCLGRNWWHQGIMSEALQAVMDFFFDTVEVNSIRSYHDPKNPHSGMVMTHCGMKFEGTLRASDRNNTGICDASWYSIQRTER